MDSRDAQRLTNSVKGLTNAMNRMATAVEHQNKLTLEAARKAQEETPDLGLTFAQLLASPVEDPDEIYRKAFEALQEFRTKIRQDVERPPEFKTEGYSPA